MQNNKLLTLKLEDRNRVRDNLDLIMEHVHDLIADKYLERECEIEITNIDIVNFGITGIDFGALRNNIYLVYGKMVEAGYNVTLYSDHESEYIQVSV